HASVGPPPVHGVVSVLATPLTASTYDARGRDGHLDCCHVVRSAAFMRRRAMRTKKRTAAWRLDRLKKLAWVKTITQSKHARTIGYATLGVVGAAALIGVAASASHSDRIPPSAAPVKAGSVMLP